MSRAIRTVLCAALAMVLSLPAAAAEEMTGTDGPGAQILPYLEEHNMNEANCAIGWYDLETGDSWYFGADTYIKAGSMYKLPLVMAVTDKIAAGELDPEGFTRGYQIGQAIEWAIVYSDNDAAQALRYTLAPDKAAYRNCLAAYSGIPLEDLPEEYYSDNRMSPRFMIGTLLYLYEHSDQYGEIIENMKASHPGRYFQSTQGEYEIAHKYGYFEGALNDCAIVYTPRPFLLVVFTKNVSYSEDRLGELCAMMTDYALTLETLPSPDPAPTPAPAPEDPASYCPALPAVAAGVAALK